MRVPPERPKAMEKQQAPRCRDDALVYDVPSRSRRDCDIVTEPALQQAHPASNVMELTVSELSGAIKRLLEDGFGYVRVRGEISGYRGPHSSGHAYLCLKDDRAKIDAVVWRSTMARLRFKPEEG